MASAFFEAVANLATAVRRSCSSVREGGGDAPSPHPEQWPESADKPALQELAGSTVKTKTGQFGFVPVNSAVVERNGQLHLTVKGLPGNGRGAR